MLGRLSSLMDLGTDNLRLTLKGMSVLQWLLLPLKHWNNFL